MAVFSFTCAPLKTIHISCHNAQQNTVQWREECLGELHTWSSLEGPPSGLTSPQRDACPGMQEPRALQSTMQPSRLGSEASCTSIPCKVHSHLPVTPSWLVLSGFSLSLLIFQVLIVPSISLSINLCPFSSFIFGKVPRSRFLATCLCQWSWFVTRKWLLDFKLHCDAPWSVPSHQTFVSLVLRKMCRPNPLPCKGFSWL